MTRRAMWLFAAVVVAAMLAPQAVYAAVGSFSSSNSTAAVNGNNTATGTNVAPGGRFSCKANGCRALWAESFGVGSSSYGLVAASRDPSGKGVAGINTATTGQGIGVYGQTNSSTGRAVSGIAYRTGGVTAGGAFETRSSTAGASGVFGLASSTIVNGSTYGVFGRNHGGGPNASGVFGLATNTTGDPQPQVNGVWGRAESTNGAGLFGEGGAYGFYGAGGHTGGYGFGQVIGIAGDTCDNPNCIGDGTFGLLSYSDVGVAGHLVQGTLGRIAGTCETAGLDSACTFATPFPVAPIVVASPVGEYSSGQWWLGEITTTGFHIHKSSTGIPATFHWIAIGLDTGMTTLAPQHQSRARAAH